MTRTCYEKVEKCTATWHKKQEKLLNRKVKHELKQDSDCGFTDSNHHTICLQSTAPKLLLHVLSWLTREICARAYLVSVKVYFFWQRHLVYGDSCHSAVFLLSTYKAPFQASAAQHLGTALF